MQSWDGGGKIVEQMQPNLDKLVRMGKKQKWSKIRCLLSVKNICWNVFSKLDLTCKETDEIFDLRYR